MKFNPYKILRVKKNAAKEEIHGAFKQLAKTHHPDIAGGENEKFNQIKAARDLLMDDRKRKLYDDFGVVPGDDVSELRLRAAIQLTGLFGEVISQVPVKALVNTDIIGILRNHVNEQIGKIEKEISDFKASAEHYQAVLAIMKKRMKRKGAIKHNLFIDALENNITLMPGRIAMKEHEKKLQTEMLAVLDNYSFDFEPSYASPFSTSSIMQFTVHV